VTDPSRPVRAIVGVLGGWTAVRAAMLLPSDAAAVDHVRVSPIADGPKPTQPLIPADIWTPPPPAPQVTLALDDNAPVARGHAVAIALDEPTTATGASVGAPVIHRASAQEIRPGPEALPPLLSSSVKRFSGSAWALSRSDGAGSSLANGGQLGGSQVGARIFYTPGPQALALTARFSAPLASPRGREASVGVALRGKNVGLIVEQRFALDKGGRDAPSVTAYGGVSEVQLGYGIRLDGYAQAGVVGIRHPQGFVDGAIRLETTVAQDRGSRLSAGLALSGGAQPGVSRLDIGPQLVARLPVGNTALRVSAEWRQRVAGNAAPGSGPAVTVGFDF
jgi:hypothetical protein